MPDLDNNEWFIIYMSIKDVQNFGKKIRLPERTKSAPDGQDFLPHLVYTTLLFLVSVSTRSPFDSILINTAVLCFAIL